MTNGRVQGVYKNRLGASMSSTVTTGATVLPVDSFVVDFDEDGGQLQHGPTGDIYSYASADFDAETITLTAALPSGRTLSADDAVYVYPRADDYYADVAVDDVAEDTVSARVPQMLRTILEEGGSPQKKGPLVRLEAGSEEWEVTELVGEAPELDTGVFYSGDLKWTARSVAGGGALVDGGWLKGDNTAVSRSTFATLYAAIGTTYGNGNGSTTFNLPDARDRTVFGIGTQVTLGANDGAAVGDRGPAHTHNIPNGGTHNHTFTQANLNQMTNTTASGSANRLTAPEIHDHGFQEHSGHDHTGTTGSGVGTSNPMGYIGFHLLVKT